MSEDIINQIAFIRARNNEFWMQILEIALEVAPEETKKVLRAINANDSAVSWLLAELAK